jgi:hypothetical protein
MFRVDDVEGDDGRLRVTAAECQLAVWERASLCTRSVGLRLSSVLSLLGSSIVTLLTVSVSPPLIRSIPTLPHSGIV